MSADGGSLLCDGVSVEAIRDRVGRDRPFFLDDDALSAGPH